jgi:hypothetical protein
MKNATELLNLPPGSAWNEATRRAFVISIAGFFVPNLLANFGMIPQLHQSFQFMPGICGAAGIFTASMAFFLGYFHHKLIQGAPAALACFILPYFATWLWFRVTHPSASTGLLELIAPALIVAIGTYFVLLQWHATLSNIMPDDLTEQIAGDEYGKPKARLEQATYRICQVIGAVLILLLILSAFGQGR